MQKKTNFKQFHNKYKSLYTIRIEKEKNDIYNIYIIIV